MAPWQDWRNRFPLTVVLEIGLTNKHLIIIFLNLCQDRCLNILLSLQLLNEAHC